MPSIDVDGSKKTSIETIAHAIQRFVVGFSANTPSIADQHIDRQRLGSKTHKLGPSSQVSVHPSSLFVFPSSHCSDPSFMPFQHIDPLPHELISSLVVSITVKELLPALLVIKTYFP